VLEAASRWELKDGVVYAGISSPVYLFYPFGGSLTKYMETEGNAIGDVDMWSKGARWAGVCAEGEAEQEAGTSRMGGRAADARGVRFAVVAGERADGEPRRHSQRRSTPAPP
jgi:hypothetical protein